MKLNFISLAVFVLGFSASASAAEYDIMGIGTQTCGQYADVYRMSPTVADNSYFSWAQGYMSGINLGFIANGGKSKNLNSISPEEQRHTLRQYCDEHPLAQYNKAVLDLLTRFQAMSPDKPAHQ
jgi:hypothetical protein